MPSQLDSLPAAVQAALRQGNTIEAIKRLREATGLGLKESKDAIDRHLRGMPPAPAADSPATHAVPEAAVHAMQRGRKILAISIVRKHTGLGLADAKRAVEAIQVDRGAAADGLAPGEVPRRSSAPWIVALLVVAAFLIYRWLGVPG
jgi:ribosomal protein L7/L12